MEVVGLDFGGTALKAGRVDERGELRAEAAIPIALERGAADVLDRAAALARELGAADRLGLGMPGLIDRATGVVERSPNLPQLDGVPVVAELARRLALDPTRVLMENDANLAALGEQWRGAGRGRADLMIVTLGTGIGGGIVLGGRLFAGPGGRAGEIGHLCIDPAGPPCGSGVPGCVEGFASATAARRRALAAGLPAERPGDLELLAARGRAEAGPERALLLEIGRDLGRGVAAAVVLLDLECFVFAGGFSAALDVLRPGILEGIRRHSFGERRIELLAAELGNAAGWIGAARLALELPD